MLEIGTSRRGRRVALTDKERARHVHIIGSTGTGKSKVLENMIRQDVARRRGLCLVDPHGTLSDKIEEWCALRRFGRHGPQIHIIKPGDDNLVPGFNPLRTVPGEALSVRVDAMVGACAQAWGVANLSETPRLEKILTALFYVLAVRRLTLAEGPALLRASDPEHIREILTTNLPEEMHAITWGELNAMSRREFAEHVESAITRLSKFLAAPAMKLVVGQRNHAIDFRTAMDNSEIVLVNLGARESFSYANARVLGTLLINDLFLTALGRNEELGKKRPFTLYIDEAYDFLSGDVENILDQTRKFGLHAVLAHQRLGQLKERGQGIYDAVMGITNKIVLGGLSDDDAEPLAREIMRGDIDLKRKKAGITTPVVVGEELHWLASESVTEGKTRSRVTTESIATSESSGLSEGTTDTYSTIDGQAPTQYGTATTAGTNSSTTITNGVSISDGHATSTSRTTGYSQALKAIREERETHFLSLEEQFHLAQLKLRNLPDQHAIVKRRGQRTVEVETTEVKSMLKMPKTVQKFRDAMLAKSSYVSTIEAAQAELKTRFASLMRKPTTIGVEESDFWHESPG